MEDNNGQFVIQETRYVATPGGVFSARGLILPPMRFDTREEAEDYAESLEDQNQTYSVCTLGEFRASLRVSS